MRGRPARLLRAFLACVVLAAATAGASRAASVSLPTIERQVMCVTCKIPLNVAQSPQANREREYIRTLIAEGHDESEIKDALVVQYSSAVLACRRRTVSTSPPIWCRSWSSSASSRCWRSCCPAGAGARPRALRSPPVRSAPRSLHGSSPTSHASTDPAGPYISWGALIPSRARQEAIVRMLARHRAMRCSSTIAGSAPSTRQSR